jgi:signal transduction histidine kinase
LKGPFNSLQSRIVLFHVIAIILAAAAVPTVDYIVIDRSTTLFEARTLHAHAETIARYLQRDSPDHWTLKLPADLNTLYSHRLDGLSFRISDGLDRTLFAAGDSPEAGAVPLMEGPLFHLSQNVGEFYGIATKKRVDGSEAWVVVVQDTQHPDVIFDDIVSYYLSRVGWLTIGILALVLIADIIVIRKVLEPVIGASRIASMINPKRTDIRLPTAGLPAELLPLITATNDALGRLDKGIRLQREFTADAAHELRTPLAVLRTRLDAMPNSDMIAEAKRDADAMANAVGQLLDMADLEDVNLGIDDDVDLKEVSLNLVGLMAPIAIAQGKELALTVCDEPVIVLGNGTMAFRAVRNLVDNAVKFSPAGSCVDVAVMANGAVFIMDRGPGIPPQERDFVFQRFWRAQRDNVEGVGLGLAIVDRIAELIGLSITISDRPGGGASFKLQFRLKSERKEHPGDVGPI